MIGQFTKNEILAKTQLVTLLSGIKDINSFGTQKRP